MLSDATKERLRAAAEENGIDPAEVIAEAEKRQASKAEPAKDNPTPDAAPLADRLLIGFLPFITVNELRTIWLKLPPIKDGALMTGEFAIKYGGTPAPITSAPGDTPQ